MISSLNQIRQKGLKSDLVIIALLYTFIVVAKIIVVLIWVIPTPSVYFDELFYAKGAESFINSADIAFQGNPTNVYPPLYSIGISFAYILTDPGTSYLATMVMNGIIFSTIIFPIWLLVRMFLSQREALYVTILVSVFLPYNYSFLFTVMSENMFIPLVALSVFLLLKSILNSSLKYDLLCGFVLGLAYLTKTTGLILVLAYIICLIVYSTLTYREQSAHPTWSSLKFDYLGYLKHLTKGLISKWAVIGSFVLTTLPWIIRNIQTFAPSTLDLSSKIAYGIIGRYGKYGDIDIASARGLSISVPQGASISALQGVASQFCLHLGYAILAMNIVLFLFILYIIPALKSVNRENKELFLFATSTLIIFISFLTIASIHITLGNLANPDAYQYLRARYVDPIIPVLVVLGFIGINRYNQSKSSLRHLILPMIVSGCVLLIAPPIYLRTPINAIMIQYLGNISLYEYGLVVALVLITTAVIILLKKNLSITGVTMAFAILFIFSSYSAYSTINWSSTTQFTPDQNEIISWVNEQGFNEQTLFIVDHQANTKTATYLANALTYFTHAKYQTGIAPPNENTDAQYCISDSQQNYTYFSEVHKTDLHWIYSIDSGKIRSLQSINIGPDRIHPHEMHFTLPVQPQEYIWLETEKFSGFTNHTEGWGKFSNGLILSGANALENSTITAPFSNNFDDEYNIWIRSQVFDYSRAKYGVGIDSESIQWIEHEKSADKKWQWVCIESYPLKQGDHKICLANGGKYHWAGINTLLITNNLSYVPDENAMQRSPKGVDTVGQPRQYGSEAGLYLWQDETLAWHIKLDPDNQIGTTSLNITSDGKMHVIATHGIEESNLVIQDRRIIYSSIGDQHSEQGFNIISEGEKIHFDIQYENISEN